MPPTVYNDGSQYGQDGVLYGRISGQMLEAQVANVRSTGLKVSVVDDRLNAWELLTHSGAISPSQYFLQAIQEGHVDKTSSFYWGYRGVADVLRLSNGTIVRARIGNGTYDDRQVYIQTITDPSNVSQWTSWSLLYSGTHFAVSLVPSGASTYDVYHSKLSVGLCKNNSLFIAEATDGEDLGRAIRIATVQTPDGSKLDDFLMLTLPMDCDEDLDRSLDLYYWDGGSDVHRSNDNFKWNRNSVALIEDPTDSSKWFYFRSFPFHIDPRTVENGESITVTRVNDYSTDELVSPPLIIRGLSGRAGYNIVTLVDVYYASDGYFYLVYGEYHADENFDAIQNATFVVWQRSKDGIHWSEPTLIGIVINGFAGMFEHDGYMYAVGNGTVARRPMTGVSYVLDNYVPQVNFDMPRDNQEGSGTAIVANPGGINDELLDLSDRRIVIEPGIKVADGTYEYQQLNDLWIKRVTEEGVGAVSRLNLELGDVWTRLSTPLRDTFNIIGQTNFEDWGEGKDNDLFVYYFPDSSDATDTNKRLTLPSGGVFLWTGWKGHNPDFSITFNAAPVDIYVRYVDDQNYIKFNYSGSTLTGAVYRDGVANTFWSGNIGSGGTTLRIVLKWGAIRVYKNGSLVVNENPPSKADEAEMFVQPGYVGAGSTGEIEFTNLKFVDWEYPTMSHDLVKFALAMGGYHDVVVGGPNNPQYALIWGPQTDLDSAAAGLRNVLEAEKLELIWRDGVIEVGQFKDLDPIYTLQDEVISTNFQDEANRRINLSIVDGNEDSWFQADSADTRERGRQIVSYLDLPELMTQQAVKDRAIEEIRRSKIGQSPSGIIPLFFDIRRMDPLIWIDNLGRSFSVRIEGISIEINQSTQPRQNMTLDNSLL